MGMQGEPGRSAAEMARRTVPALPLILALCAATVARAAPAVRTDEKSPTASRAALELLVADYTGLYAKPTLDRWRTLFHESLVVAYPTEEGGIRARGLDEFFKAQKDYFETGRRVSERLENVRIDEGWRIARVSADFVFVDEGQERRGKLGLHLVETGNGWKITAILFSYDRT